MAVTQYIGARYVPLLADPVEWSSTKQYDPLTIVTHDGNSYTSRQYVPVGVAITNESYWACTGNYNAQIELYREETERVGESVNALSAVIPGSAFDATNTVKAYIDTAIDSIDAVIVPTFPTVVAMRGANLEAGHLYRTMSFDGDGGGSLYLATASGTADGVTTFACATGYATLVPRPMMHASEFGCAADGITDDTGRINRALEYCDTLVLDQRGPYLVSIQNETTYEAIRVPSGKTLDGNARVVRLLTTELPTYRVVYLENGATITNAVIRGDADSHVITSGTTDEWGCGIYANGKGSRVTNCDVSRCFGDGVTLNADGCVVSGTTSHENGRNNISVTRGSGVLIEGCELYGAYRTAPMAGIDIEPNMSGKPCDVTVRDTLLHDNASTGISIENHSGECRSIVLEGITMVEDDLKIRNYLLASNITYHLMCEITGLNIVHKTAEKPLMVISQHDAWGCVNISNCSLMTEYAYAADTAPIYFKNEYNRANLHVNGRNVHVYAPNAVNLFYGVGSSVECSFEVSGTFSPTQALHNYPAVRVLKHSQSLANATGYLHFWECDVRATSSSDITLTVSSNYFPNESMLYVRNYGSANVTLVFQGYGYHQPDGTTVTSLVLEPGQMFKGILNSVQGMWWY